MLQQASRSEKIFGYTSLLLLISGTVAAIPLEDKALGFSLLALGAGCLAATSTQFAKHIILVFISIGLLALTPISPDIDFAHFLTMGSYLSLAVLVPLLITRYVYKEKIIRFPIGKHTWTRGHIGYLLLAAALSYVLLPLWMSTTGGYQYWTVVLEPLQLFVLFLGTNGLGIWDELFFIVTVLALLRKHLPFYQANLVQAVLFTSFLYELGFRGWAPFAIFPFALLQGIVFKKTENLLYIIAIHLTIDLVLYLALINAFYPDVLDIFLTN